MIKVRMSQSPGPVKKPFLTLPEKLTMTLSTESIRKPMEFPSLANLKKGKKAIVAKNH